MKQFLALCLALVALAVSGQEYQTFETINVPGAPETGLKMVKSKKAETTLQDLANSKVRTTTSPKQRRSAAKEGEKMVHATIKFPMLQEEWDMPYKSFDVFNDDYYKSFSFDPYDEEWNFAPTDHVDIELPEGTYQVMGKFFKMNPDNLYGRDKHVIYIAEDVEVTEGAVIVMNPEESTVCLAMETTNPNGEKTRFRQIEYDENLKSKIIEEGNIADAMMIKVILFNGETVNTQNGNAGGIVALTGAKYFNAQENCNFYVNSISDRFEFVEIRMMDAYPDVENGMYLTVTHAKGAHEGVYTNEEKYVLDDSGITPTPGHELYPVIETEWQEAYPFQVDYEHYINGSSSGYGVGLLGKNPYMFKIWSSKPANEYKKGELYCDYRKMSNDIYQVFEYDWGEWVVASPIYTQYYFPFAENGIELVTDPFGMMSMDPEDEELPIAPYPGNTAFSAPLISFEMEAGESAPLLTSYVYPSYYWEIDKYLNTFSPMYTGRMEELLYSTRDLANVSLSVDGEKIADNANDATAWMIENQDNPGNYEFTVETNNFEIDGIIGGNKGMVTYSNSGDDVTPPSATMLQFRTADGYVAQQFANVHNVEMRLSATDFDVHIGEPNEWGQRWVWFDLSTPEKVEAWVSANGSDAEVVCNLDLSEDPEGFYHGFGALYKASLADLDITSPNGWFDLTILVEDAAGNRQLQTLSPAFKVESLTGVQTVAMKEGVRVSGGDIIAPVGSRAFTVNGTECGLSGLKPGIYIVRTPSAAAKVVVK